MTDNSPPGPASGRAVLGRALAEGDGVLGSWLRTGRTSALASGAAAPLAGPDRPVRLSDAFGRR